MCLKDLNEVDVTERRSSLGRSTIMWPFIHLLGSENSRERESVCVCRQRDREERHPGIPFFCYAV